MVVCLVGVVGSVGRDTGLISSAERRGDIPLGPHFLLRLPHSQVSDFWVASPERPHQSPSQKGQQHAGTEKFRK